jgi:hypothetical protein
MQAGRENLTSGLANTQLLTGAVGDERYPNVWEFASV